MNIINEANHALGDLVNEADNVDAIVKKIAEMTHYNDHMGSVMELAKFANHKNYIKILEHINAIYKLNGSMPYSLGQYRSVILKDLLQYVKEKYGQEIANKFHGAF